MAHWVQLRGRRSSNFLSQVAQARLGVGVGVAIVAVMLNVPTIASPADTLALINGEPVTSEAFKYRFELSVYPGRHYPTNIDSSKKQFLLSLIAEKLLASGAQSENLLDAEDEKLRVEAEEMFLRDALFRKEVVGKVKITKEEVSQSLELLTYTYRVDAFYLPDSASANRFYARAIKVPSEKFYAFVSSSKISHDTLEISFGESTGRTERAFFGHEPGFLSVPTITEDGFVVFRILERTVNKRFSSATAEERLSWVQKVLKSRKEERLGFEYIRKFLHGVKVRVNPQTLRRLAFSIQALLKTHHPRPIDPHYHLSAEEAISLRSSLAGHLAEPLLYLGLRSMSLEDVIEKLPLSGFTAEDTSVRAVTIGLHTSLKFISQNYFLSKRARELGLQNSPEVNNNVQLMLDAFRSYRTARSITEHVTISEAEVDSFFNVHRDVVLNQVALRVEEYQAADVIEAVGLFNRLNHGESLASSTSEPSRKEIEADSGWIRASKLGEVGALIAELKPGQIYGPVPHGRKYIIYKLMEKKSAVSDSVLANSIQVAREVLLAEKKRRVLNEYIARLAQENDVKVYLNRLHAVAATPIQMYTVRYLGFGGKVSAVPPLYPREEWIKYLQKKAAVVQ